MSSVLFNCNLACYNKYLLIFHGLSRQILYFVRKRDKMNSAQYLTSTKVLTNYQSFPQAVSSTSLKVMFGLVTLALLECIPPPMSMMHVVMESILRYSK